MTDEYGRWVAPNGSASLRANCDGRFGDQRSSCQIVELLVGDVMGTVSSFGLVVSGEEQRHDAKCGVQSAAKRRARLRLLRALAAGDSLRGYGYWTTMR